MSSEISNCSQQFQNDFDNTNNPHSLENDAYAFNTALTDESDALAAVRKEVDDLADKYKGHPGELLIVIIVKVLGTRRDHYFQTKLKVNADAIQIQADISKLTNDIQGTINDKSTNPQDVINVAAETDEMQNVFGTSSQSASVGEWASYISGEDGAIGTASSSFMCENFQKIREDINWSADPEAKAYNTGANPHFLVGGSGQNHFTTYSQMFNDLTVQGDPLGAQEANKIILDNYNQNVSVTQSLGAASNTKIGLITSEIKMNTSAESDFAQDILTGNRTAINNQIPKG